MTVPGFAVPWKGVCWPEWNQRQQRLRASGDSTGAGRKRERERSVEWMKFGVACATVGLILGGSVMAGAWEKALDERVDAAKDAQVKAVQEVIAIKSYNHGSPTTPSEGVKQALDAMLAMAEKMGMRTTKHPDYRYGYVEIGPENAPEMVMVLGHLDTVPEGNPDLWTLGSPFEGKIVEGKIVGRGATDDKGPCVAALYALKAINEAQIPLERRIRLFFGTSEDGAGDDELSWSCVETYAALCREGKEEWPTLGFSPDSGSFSVTYIEKTGVNVLGNLKLGAPGAVKLAALKGGSARNAVSDLCSVVFEAADEAGAEALAAAVAGALTQEPWKGDVTVKVTGKTVSCDVIGVAAHSGQAWKGKNANVRTLFLMSRMGPEETWGKHAAKLVELIGVDVADGAALGIKQGDPKPDDNITVNMGLVGLKSADVDPTLTFHVNIRYPGEGADLKVPDIKHYTGAELREKVAEAFRQKGFEVGDGKEVALTGGAKPYTVPWDSEIVTKLRQAYAKSSGKDLEPEIVFGGTYASAWQNEPVDDKGTLFGYRMAAWGIEGGGGEHEPNEYLTIDGMMQSTKVLARAMASLGGAKE